MEDLFFFVLVAMAITWFATGALTTPLIILGGFLSIFLLKKLYERQKKLEDHRRLRMQEEMLQMQSHTRQQEANRAHLLTLCESSLTLFEDIPKHLLTTEELLDQAAVDFQDRAFAPFWDAIEKAVSSLGQIDQDVQLIAKNAAEHKTMSGQYDGETPSFPINPHTVEGIKATAPFVERLRALVRKAQTDFEFATIYEQRKTNRVLAAGFFSLGQALDGMGHQISSSLATLSAQVKATSAETVTALSRIQSRIEDNSDAVLKCNRELLMRHDRVIEMLDNIQRRKRPRPEGWRDGEY